MKIRVLTIEDYPEISRLWGSIPGIGMRSLDDSREGIAKYLGRNPSTSFAAEEDGTIIGVILCGHDGRRGFIYHTAVDPEHRGQGVGKALVHAALEALKEEQIHKVALVAYSSNEAGNRFWEEIGFSERTDLTYRNRSLNDQNV